MIQTIHLTAMDANALKACKADCSQIRIRLQLNGLSMNNPCTLPLPVDVLSSMLETVHLRVISAGRSCLAPPWGFRVGDGMASFYVVVRGRCWLQLDEAEPALELSSGDLAVLLQGKRHRLLDDPQSDVVPVEKFFTPAHIQKQAGLAMGKTGPRTTLVHGSFTWIEDELVPLLPMLPPVIHVKSGDAPHLAPWMNKALSMIADESVSYQPGAQTIINHLAHVVFVQGVRAYLITMPHASGRWLEAVAHRQIGTALCLLHTRPEGPWSLTSLAKKCGMSRSAFAEKFARLVGRSPMRYLLERRMHKASILLRQSSISMKEISVLAGYGSEAAFSNAFKRWAGVAPGVYRRSSLCQSEVSSIHDSRPAPSSFSGNAYFSVMPVR